ncbi:MAG: divalent cation tolerance protein CutA [Patescibacteria group bacterium]
MVFIYTTCATSEEANNLGKLIINKKLGVAVDFWLVDSMFRWKKEFVEVPQVMMMISTFESKIKTINDLISQNHSYSTPLIAGVDVRRINRAYKEWMMEEVA